MEKECKFIKNIKRKQNIIITILSVIIIFNVCSIVPWNIISNLYKDNYGNFSNEILWTSIGAIGSILALMGIIITIIYTEYSRKKQNEYEYKKQQLLEEHTEFKKEVKQQLEILDPIAVITETIRINDIYNNVDIREKLNNYILKIKSIDYKIYWYYNRTLQGNYIELSRFINELNIFIDYMTEKINEYNKCLSDFYDISKRANANSNEDIEKFINEIGKIKNQIVNHRNKKWHILVENAKIMIEEREKIIKEIIEKVATMF